MFSRILVAVDGSPTSRRGLQAALALAKDQRARVSLLHVIDDTPIFVGLDGGAYMTPAYMDNLLDGMREAGRRTLARAQAIAAKAGVEVETVLAERLGASVAATILQQARKLRADVIVLGTHGRRGFGRIVMGSDAEEVLRGARVPVLLVRAPGGRPGSGTKAPTRAPHRRPTRPAARRQPKAALLAK